MNNKFESIKYRLESWGESEAKPVPGLSYPGNTIESRMIESGCITSNVAVRTIPPHKPNKYNLEIDQAVYNLDKFDRKMVYEKYVYQHPLDRCLVLSNRSKASYYAKFDSIYYFISGWIKYSLK